MKKPVTQADFDAYAATPEGRDYLASDLFRERFIGLLARFDAGEEMEAIEAAKVVGLPWPVFRHVYAMYLTGKVQLMGSPSSGSLN